MIKKEFFIWYHLGNSLKHTDVIEHYTQEFEQSEWWRKQIAEAPLRDIDIYGHRDQIVLSKIAWDHTLNMKSLFKIKRALEDGDINKAETILNKLIK